MKRKLWFIERRVTDTEGYTIQDPEYSNFNTSGNEVKLAFDILEDEFISGGHVVEIHADIAFIVHLPDKDIHYTMKNLLFSDR